MLILDKDKRNEEIVNFCEFDFIIFGDLRERAKQKIGERGRSERNFSLLFRR